MSAFLVEVEGGETVRLPTAGKYCPQDILVTGNGGDTEAAYNEGYQNGAKEGAEVGYAKGEQEGYNKGHTDGVVEGIEQGKAEAIESLPNGYLKIDPAWNSWYMLCNGRPSIVQSLKYEDSANATHFISAFQSCNVEIIPRLDLRKATTIQNMFIYSSSIVEIGEMEIPKVTVADNAFAGCSKLERISFAKECIHVSISFSSCSKLGDASIQSIIDGLADLTGKTAQTLTFHKDVGNKLTQAQKDAASAKNWTLAY